MMTKRGRTSMTLGCLCGFAQLIAAGCATDVGDGSSPRFGESVRQNLATQTASPSSGAPGMSGVKAMTALQAYRRDVGDFGSVDEPLNINVGN